MIYSFGSTVLLFFIDNMCDIFLYTWLPMPTHSYSYLKMYIANKSQEQIFYCLTIQIQIYYSSVALQISYWYL